MKKKIFSKYSIGFTAIILALFILLTGCQNIILEESSVEEVPSQDLTEEEKEETYKEFYLDTKAEVESLTDTLLEDIKNPKVSISWLNGVLEGIESLEGHAKKCINYTDSNLPEKYRSAHYDLKESMENFLNLTDRAKTSLKNFDIDTLKTMEQEATDAYSSINQVMTEMDNLMEG